MINYFFYKSSKEIKTDVKEALRGSWGQCVKATLVFSVICLALIGMSVLFGIFIAWWSAIPLGLFSMLLISILSYGYTYFCHKLALQEKAEIKFIFFGFSKKIFHIIKLSIKKFVLGLIWLVMLILPFFIKSIGYSMATLLLIDKAKVNDDSVLKESSHLMKDNYGRYFKFIMSFTLWYLLVIVSLGIAFLWVAPKVMTAKAVFYENLKTEF